MKTTLLIAALSASFTAARSTVRHFYTSDFHGEYARQVGFRGDPVLWGYGLRDNLPGTTALYTYPVFTSTRPSN
ncbi:hypothetical protein CKM354_000596900 [Cercospora kikuchii]|uniref:Uncharacterized protein n=1 Tax=Cercospora kikuchii TaxID=84275 RepID=A0A9P3CLK0_9PEZI|nr:uncharacterized protein CKM354_000596900 [Cercospora kikuchii]GIZ42710.1 hypothetical protein CKM354_000596900 [Cercospora kikuchii]